jgi:DNA-binding MarR family transcriptional regulator
MSTAATPARGAGSPQDAPPQDAPPQDAPPQDAPPQDAPPQDASPQDASTQDAALEEVRTSFAGLFAAERRLRGRDHASGELTHAHIRSVHALSDGEMTAGELARSAELNPASVTAMLDHLEGVGIVERRRSTTDRRVCHVALTEKGRELLAIKTARWKERWTERLGGYDAAELAIAGQIARDVTELLDSITLEKSRRAGD